MPDFFNGLLGHRQKIFLEKPFYGAAIALCVTSEQVSLLYPNLSMFIAASVWRGSDFCTSGLFARQ